uniref:Cytochrome c oxidase subunit 3 n=1 Tax=Grandidierella fasciata TaxID=2614734 RepID=A0A5H2YB64_9CRUS|nr:cytochrome c oxidase subunit 3 [Grandidierella fasciata]
MTAHMNHPYHLVEKSPWPLTASVGAFVLTSGLVKWFHLFSMNLFFIGLLTVLISSVQWWRDVTREGTFQGLHTVKVVEGLQLGMILFILSEVLFFFSFFWAFFHSSLNPTLEIGGQWPPTAIVPFNPFQIPLLNTLILLSSGVTVTWAHHSILENKHNDAIQGLALTVFLGLYFTALQAMEYVEAPFSIADSVYGSTFFVATGFHGLHVIIGTMFLLVMLTRLLKGHFSKKHHFGLEAAIWYWHFVDVVWLFLYTFIYWWGN